MKAVEILIAVIGGVAFLVCLSLLLSLPVYFLWNGCLVGAIDGVKEVTWLQACLFTFCGMAAWSEPLMESKKSLGCKRGG